MSSISEIKSTALRRTMTVCAAMFVIPVLVPMCIFVIWFVNALYLFYEATSYMKSVMSRAIKSAWVGEEDGK